MTQNLFNLLFKSCEKRLKFNNTIIINSGNFYKNLKDKLNKKIILKDNANYLALQDEINVFCTISIFFSLSNTWLSVITSSGKVIFSVSAGSLGLKGKQKSNRHLAIKKIVKVLNQIYLNFVDFSPILALHITNSGSYKMFVIKTVKNFFLITSIKTFDLNPYNGCRKKKYVEKKLHYV